MCSAGLEYCSYKRIEPIENSIKYAADHNVLGARSVAPHANLEGTHRSAEYTST